MDNSIVNWALALLFLVVFAIWWAKPHLVARFSKWRMQRREKAMQERQVQREAEDIKHKAGNDKASEESYDKLIVLHVEAREGKKFSGAKVIEQLETAELAPGDMQMYQYYVDYRGMPRLVFNVINGVEPGYLDKEFSKTETPCLTLFFALNDSYDPRKSLNAMLRLAEDLARNLDGLLQDNDRSALTEQTKQHLIDTVERYILNSPHPG